VKSIGQAELELHGDVLVARVVGEIDLSNVDDIEATITQSVTPETTGLLLDFTPTTYLDSAGIRMVFELARRLEARRHRLRLVAGSETLVHRVITLTQLSDTVPVDRTVADALGALAATE
jgi:anti-anti-sigma factor